MHPLLLVALALISAALAEPDGASGEDLELSAEDLKAIEEALAADMETQVSTPEVPLPLVTSRGATALQSLNPDISFIADIALAALTSDMPLQTGGHDPTANGFNLQQLELSVSKPVDPYFRFDANIVFSQFGVEVEEVYATTLGMPWRLQMRVGQFLTRFGRVNATHPHTWDFVDQSFAIGRVFGAEGNRGLGLELSWLAPLPWYLEILVSETMIGGEATNRSWKDFVTLGVKGPLDLQITVACKQFFPLTPDLSLMWGLSYAGGPNGTGRINRSEVYGSDLYFKYRPITTGSYSMVSLHTEWFYRRRQVPDDIISDASGFTQFTWRFARRWALGARHELGTPEKNSDGDTSAEALDPHWTSSRHRAAINTTFWPTEFSRLRLQGGRDFAEWIEEPAWSAFLAFEFNVGAHGAHTF
ncbi:MAG: zinc-regulated TonB-dependent outer membrane receptor [Proteobacteria bacterium]|nr:zinc-regulated TonB-dependent outer membrane receptor [Pseudomonadota bacterium]